MNQKIGTLRVVVFTNEQGAVKFIHDIHERKVVLTIDGKKRANAAGVDLLEVIMDSLETGKLISIERAPDKGRKA